MAVVQDRGAVVGERKLCSCRPLELAARKYAHVRKFIGGQGDSPPRSIGRQLLPYESTTPVQQRSPNTVLRRTCQVWRKDKILEPFPVGVIFAVVILPF